MKKRLLSLFLVFIFLLTAFPLGAFANEEGTVDKRTELKVETVERDGKSYIEIPIGKLEDESDSGRISLMAIKDGTQPPTSGGAGQEINAAAAIVWQMFDWDFPAEGFKAKLKIGNDADPRTNTTIAEVQVKGTVPIPEKVSQNNFQFITTDKYQVGDENKDLKLVFDNSFRANCRISAGYDSDAITNGKCYYIVVTQITFPAYTAEWYDNGNKDTRPTIKGALYSAGNKKAKVDVYKENLKYGSISNKTPSYVDEHDINGKTIGMVDFVPTGPITEPQLTMTPGQNPVATGKFVSYVTKNMEPPTYQPVETENPLNNTKGKIPKHGIISMNGTPTLESPAYFYQLIGDNNHMWRFQMRQVLQVKLNSGAGKVNDNENQLLHVGRKDSQEIGHSEKIYNNDVELTDYIRKLYPKKANETDEQLKKRVSEATQSQRVINFTTDETVTPPKVKIGGKDVDTVPDGWATAPQTIDAEGKLSDATGKLVNADGSLTDEGKAFLFKEKETTLYQVFKAPQKGKVNIKYVDEKGKEIDAKYHKDGEKYPAFAEGQVGEAVKESDITEPTFIGYKRTADTIKDAVSGKTFKKEDPTATATTLDEVQVKYEKLPSVIPGKDPNGGDNTKPEGYVTVTFKAGDHGKINGGTADVKFFVNPKDDVTFGDTSIKAPSIEAEGDYVVDTPNWKPDFDAKKAEKITADAEFVAQYKEKGKHTVTFDADNGTANTTEQVVDGKTATKPATDPTKNGYTFKEWQLVTDGNVSGTAYDFGTAVKSDITLKAVYTENQVKIEYVSEDTNKGTVDKAEETIGAITGAKTGSTLGSTATAMDGYRFTHWSKDGDTNFKATTAKVTPEKTNEIYVAAKYTAHFAKEVSVKYDLNAPSGLTAKGTAPTDDKKYIAGEKADVKTLLQGSGVDGCEFLGWSKDKDATTATYKANDKNAKVDIKGEEDVTLYAIWKKGTKTVKLSFEFYKKKDTGNTLQPDNALGNFQKPELKDITGQEVGAEITLPTYQGQTVNTGDLQGKWTFDGWYKGDDKVTGKPIVSATDADNQYVGKWILEETKTATVTRKFVIDPTIMGDGKDVPAGHELPDAVKVDQKVNDTTNYIGSTQTPGKDKFNAVEEKIGDKVGTWTFKEWDPKNLTVDADETKNVFTGTWTWTEKGKITVKYVFETDPKTKTLPPVLKALEKNYPDKSVYPGEAPTETPAKPEATTDEQKAALVETKDGKKVGEWKAGEWVKTTDKDGNITYTSTWKFEEVGKSKTPDVNPVKPGDKKITGKGEPGSDIEVTIPGKDEPIKTPVDENGDWTVKVPEDKELKDGDKVIVTQTEKDKNPSDPVERTVTADKKPEPRPSAPAITWRGLWFLGDSKSEPVQEMETGRHYKYLYGYVDKTVRPEGMITRSEAAALIARLANLDMTDKTKPNFKDTPSAWYNGAINAMVAKNLMFADKDGNFRPNEPITRGEFARALYYIDKKNDKVAPFADVKGHEFEDAINQAYGNGRIAGYQDGSFKPNANIQRAEAARILNQYADRNVTLDGLRGVKNDLARFTDINENHWAYCEVMEAANSHEYQRAKGTLPETWLKILDK